MRIAVTGASGFIGCNLVPVLKEAGHSLKLLYHSESAGENLGDGVEVVRGTIGDSEALDHLCRETEVVVHLVGIIVETRHKSFRKTVVEGSKNLIEACVRNGVSQIVYLSAIGAELHGSTEYFRSKAMVENMIRESGIAYMILRPSLVYGRGDGFLSLQTKILRWSPVSAIVGNGKYPMQPVYVGDLTAVVARVVGGTDLGSRIIEIGGAEILEYRQIINLIRGGMGIKRLNFYVPLWLMKTVAWLLGRLPIVPPFTVDQMKMLERGSVADIEYMKSELKVDPIRFEDGLKRCLT